MSAATQTSSGDPMAAGPTGAEILAAITDTKEDLTAKIDVLTTDVSLIRHDLDKFRSRTSEAVDLSRGWKMWPDLTPLNFMSYSCR